MLAEMLKSIIYLNKSHIISLPIKLLLLPRQFLSTVIESRNVADGTKKTNFSSLQKPVRRPGRMIVQFKPTAFRADHSL